MKIHINDAHTINCNSKIQQCSKLCIVYQLSVFVHAHMYDCHICVKGSALDQGHQFCVKGSALDQGHQFCVKGSALEQGHQFCVKGSALEQGHQFCVKGSALDQGHVCLKGGALDQGHICVKGSAPDQGHQFCLTQCSRPRSSVLYGTQTKSHCT